MSERYREYFESKQKKQRIMRLLSDGSLMSRVKAYQLAAELDLTIAEMQAMENSLIKA